MPTAFAQDSPGVLYAQTSAVSFSNSSAENTLMSVPVLGGSWRVGSTLSVTAYGTQDYAANQGVITWRVKLGTLEVYNSNDAAGAAANTNQPWALNALGICRVAGGTGTLVGGGWARYFSSSSDGSKQDVDGDAISSSVNLNADLTIALTVQYSVANAGNVVRLHLGVIRLEKL